MEIVKLYPECKDNVWGEIDAPGKGAEIDSDSEYARYKELEHKFLLSWDNVVDYQ